MTREDDGRLRQFMSGAAQRFTNAQLAVSLDVDLRAYRAALESLKPNPSAAAVLASPMFRESRRRSMWHVWLSRPYRYKVDHYSAPGRLADMAGGNEAEYWQVFPAEGRFHTHGNAEAAAQDDSRSSYFHIWLPPAVAQLLDPGSIWVRPEGYAGDPTVTAVAEHDFIGRPAIAAEVNITDWATRGAGWSEILYAGDHYEILVDKSTGILLEVKSIFRSRTVSRCGIESLFLDGSTSAEFFEVGHWTDDSWSGA
jgi:hypothetical protein